MENRDLDFGYVIDRHGDAQFYRIILADGVRWASPWGGDAFAVREDQQPEQFAAILSQLNTQQLVIA